LSAARLVIACPDRPGIVSSVSTFLYERGANIVESAQHSTDPHGGTFFMRMEFLLDGIEDERLEFEGAFQTSVAERFAMNWRMSYATERKRIGILVSRYDHCLLDLIWRWRRAELGADIVGVVSNHPDLENDVSAFGISYVHVPVDRDRKREAEEEIVDVFKDRIDLLVLARYMQILSGDFLKAVGVPVINIHHAFLPAFVGANPYARAVERGVKIIGATAHYVTEDLDAGPIIEQDVERVTHTQDAAEFERIGRDVERIVLARAVKWHIDDRVLVHGNKTFVFV
jgi:formyltetrahydrofolate deformylase